LLEQQLMDAINQVVGLEAVAKLRSSVGIKPVNYIGKHFKQTNNNSDNFYNFNL